MVLDNVEDLLNTKQGGSKPLTINELILKLQGKKNERSIYRELNHLRNKHLKKIEIFIGTSKKCMCKKMSYKQAFDELFFIINSTKKVKTKLRKSFCF